MVLIICDINQELPRLKKREKKKKEKFKRTKWRNAGEGSKYREFF